jgi:hypothetical protein
LDQLELPELIIEALSFPIEELKSYESVLETMTSIVTSNDELFDPKEASDLHGPFLHSVLDLIRKKISDLEMVKDDFKNTRLFWLDLSNSRYRKSLCLPERNFILSSKDVPIWTASSVTQGKDLLLLTVCGHISL